MQDKSFTLNPRSSAFIGGQFVVVLWSGLLTLRVEGRWALTAFQLALLALAAALIVRRRFSIHPHPVAILLAAAALWGVFQTALGISVDAHRTLEAALGWIVNCAAFSIALAVTGDSLDRRRFLTAQLFFALALSVAAVIGLLTISQLGPFVYKNQFAAYVESVLGLAIAAAIRDRRRSFAWLLVAAALFASVVAAGSRAGSILCLAELILLPAIAFTRGWISGRSLIRVAALAVLTGGVLVAVAGWETTWRRLQEPNPYSLRADLLRSSIDMARDRPLAGFGLGTWSTAYPAYARFDDGSFVNQAHNDWVQWAAEGGLPFLALMIAVVAWLARPAVESLWGLGLLAVFAHAWVDYPFEQRPALAAFFFAMAGALAAQSGASSLSTSSPAANRPRGSSPV
jgi:O-antigen ligase